MVWGWAVCGFRNPDNQLGPFVDFKSHIFPGATLFGNIGDGLGLGLSPCLGPSLALALALAGSMFVGFPECFACPSLVLHSGIGMFPMLAPCKPSAAQFVISFGAPKHRAVFGSHCRAKGPNKNIHSG